MKIGIMGGTFNPIHNGHLFLAENTREQAGLDKILFMPSKNPPHKTVSSCITQQQRVDMIRLAISDNPFFELSELELQRDGFTYTADTLTLLTEESPDISYYFIVGTDSLFMMQHWYQPHKIFERCIIAVAARENADEEQIRKHSEFLKKEFGAKIIHVQMPLIDISSDLIRKKCSDGKTLKYYLPDSVIRYIRDNRLYEGIQEDLSESGSN